MAWFIARYHGARKQHATWQPACDLWYVYLLVCDSHIVAGLLFYWFWTSTYWYHRECELTGTIRDVPGTIGNVPGTVRHSDCSMRAVRFHLLWTALEFTCWPWTSLEFTSRPGIFHVSVLGYRHLDLCGRLAMAHEKGTA